MIADIHVHVCYNGQSGGANHSGSELAVIKNLPGVPYKLYMHIMYM